jgi:pimeloyl-ACP methyl ester carboxylesterase
MSPQPATGYSFSDMVSDLHGSVPETPELLIGHSLGGALAVQAIHERVLQPRRLVLEDPALYMPSIELPKQLLAADQRLAKLGPAALLASNPRWERVDAEQRAASLAAVDWATMDAAFAGNVPWDVRSLVQAQAETMPVLLIIPDRSMFVSDADVALFNRTLGPDAVVVIHGAGHGVHRDDLPTFLQAIAAFDAHTSTGRR